MQLVSILLVIVSILTFLSGVTVFFGSSRADRPKCTWFFLASIFATIWCIAIALILTARPERASLQPSLICIGFVSSLLLDAGFLGYSAWGFKFGKISTVIFLIAALILSAIIISCPNCLFTDVTIASTGNTAEIVVGPLLFVYVAYFALILLFISFAFYFRYKKSRSKSKRISNLVVMAAASIAALFSLVANLILPLNHNWSHSWLGPLTISIVILSVYYLILRFRAINLSLTWLRILSYIVIVASIAIVYMIIFSIIFAALFRGSTPSIEVIALNFIMLLILIALLPAMSNFIRSIRRLILDQHPQKSAHHSAKTSPHQSLTKGTKKHS